MAVDASGLQVPAAVDPFDPPADFAALATSLRGRVVVPVANAAARASLLAALVADGTPATATRPALCDVGGVIQRHDGGAGWVRVSDGPLTVAATRTPGAKTIPALGTVDLIASGDPSGIPSVTCDPGGRVRVSVTLHYVAASAGVAASADLAMLVDGAVQPEVCTIHTGLGAAANVQKALAVTLEGWVSAGSHTVNVRATHTGGSGGIAVDIMTVRVYA